MDHVLGFVSGGINKGIAISSELIAGNKGKESAAARRAFEADQKGERPESESDEDENLTAQEWALDDVGDELTQKDLELRQTESTQTTEQPEDRALAFINDHQNALQLTPSGYKTLPQAVLIPQRRPGDRRRGFIRAYAPTLNEYAGIDQETFLDFLTSFDKASKSSPIFDVINLACFGVGLVPSTICFAVSTTVGTVNTIAQQLQIHYRTNSFLDKVNEALFIPHGLLAMVMAYKPDMPDDLILQADTTNPTDKAAFKAANAQNNRAKQLLRRLRAHSGDTREFQIPEPAPLIYPSLDLVLSSNQLTEQKSLVQKNALILNDYLDRRAQTDFTKKYPTSKITATLPPQEKRYVNRYADPDHPVNAGSVFATLTGGTFDPIGAGRVRRAESKAKKAGEPPLTEQERHDALMGRKVRNRVTGTPSKTIPIIGKMLKKDVLYLVIVNKPTAEDLEAVRQQLEKAKEEK